MMPREKKLRHSPPSYASEGRADSIVRYMRKVGAAIPNPVNEVAGTPVYAVVNHGRWIAECDIDKNAQFVDDDDKRFYCIVCFNVGIGRRWREVIWPNNIEKIESVLAVRQPINQNWSPGESIQMLEDENVARGLPANDGG